MSSLKSGADVLRESQDSTERHQYDQVKFGEGGATVGVKGNGTEDDDNVVLSIGGTIMNLPKGTNAEVFLLSGGDDTNVKFAVVVGPRDKQYKSQPGETWSQNPMNPEQRAGYDKEGYQVVSDAVARTTAKGNVRVTSEKSIGLGKTGALEVRADGNHYLRGNWFSERPITIGTAPYKDKE